MPAWSLFSEGVRPIAFETNRDGSTSRLFVQLSEVHGFAVVDFKEHKEVARVMLPEIPVRPARSRPLQCVALAWHRRRPGRADVVGVQPSERRGLRLLAPRSEAARRRRRGQTA
jgi:hypothetical protein